jgi:hypothetical protein
MAILTPDGVKHAHFDQTLPDRFACRPRLQQAAACFSAGVSVPERQSFGAVCYGRAGAMILMYITLNTMEEGQRLASLLIEPRSRCRASMRH